MLFLRWGFLSLPQKIAYTYFETMCSLSRFIVLQAEKSDNKLNFLVKVFLVCVRICFDRLDFMFWFWIQLCCIFVFDFIFRLFGSSLCFDQFEIMFRISDDSMFWLCVLFDFMFWLHVWLFVRFCVRFYVSTDSTLCFDFEFNYIAPSRLWIFSRTSNPNFDQAFIGKLDIIVFSDSTSANRWSYLFSKSLLIESFTPLVMYTTGAVYYLRSQISVKIIQKLTILEANEEIRIQLINKEGKHFFYQMLYNKKF